MRKFLIVLLILALTTVTACGSSNSVYKSKKGGYTSISTVNGITFDVPSELLGMSTAVSAISEDSEIDVNDYYLYKDGQSAYLLFNMNSIVISVKKGTKFQFKSASDKEDALTSSHINNIWFESESDKKLSYSDDRSSDVYKIVVNVKAQVSITPSVYGDFVGKLATIEYGDDEWSLFVGTNGTSLEDVQKNRLEAIEYIAASMAINNSYKASESSEKIVINTNEAQENPEESIAEESSGVETEESTTVETETMQADANQSMSLDNQNVKSKTGVYHLYDVGEAPFNTFRLTKIYTGDEAVGIIKAYTKTDECPYEYTDAPEGCKWAVAEYEMADSPLTTFVDVRLCGIDGEKLKVHGIEYEKRTHDIRTMYVDSGEGAYRYHKLYVYYAVPNGCKEYVLAFGDATENNSSEDFSVCYKIEVK